MKTLKIKPRISTALLLFLFTFLTAALYCVWLYLDKVKMYPYRIQRPVFMVLLYQQKTLILGGYWENEMIDQYYGDVVTLSENHRLNFYLAMILNQDPQGHQALELVNIMGHDRRNFLLFLSQLSNSSQWIQLSNEGKRKVDFWAKELAKLNNYRLDEFQK